MNQERQRDRIQMMDVTMLRDGPGAVRVEITFPPGVNLVLHAPSGGQVQKLLMDCDENQWEIIRAHIAEAEYWSADDAGPSA